MLIPRHSPDYSISDLIKAASLSSSAVEIDSSIKKNFGSKELYFLENARSCIYLVLDGLPPGEVILPGYICQVVPQAVVLAGHQPVFVDISLKDNLSMHREKLRAAISSKTRAIIAAHLFGIPCDIQDIKELALKREIVLIEDAAAALGGLYLGQPVACQGDAAVFSFGKGKALFAGGGGFLVVNNDRLKANLVKSLLKLEKSNPYTSAIMALGQKIIYYPHLYSWVYRLQRARKGGEFWETGEVLNNKKQKYRLMDHFTKKIKALQLPKLQDKIARRRQIAHIYQEDIANPHIVHLAVTNDRAPSWPCYPIIVERRQEFFHYMQDKGIDLGWSWNYSASERYGQDDCPCAAFMAQNILSLPTHPHLSEPQVQQIVRTVNDFTPHT
jgi:dTDP-4-amino-4,6-dideoxygalactose transaminase